MSQAEGEKLRSFKSLISLVCLQSVKKGEEDFRTFRKMMADLLSEIHERGEPSDNDTTIAAHLLRIRDPSTGTASFFGTVVHNHFGLTVQFCMHAGALFSL